MTELFPGLSTLRPPRMVRVLQHFDRPRIADVEAEVARQLARPDVAATLDGLGTVALAVGSRGIAGIDRIVAALVAALQAGGLEVFIVPAMGSHGGATAAGQEDVLRHLGITAASVGAPIRSSMEVVEIASVRSPHGRELPLVMDAAAVGQADAVIPVNRVKPHTGFRGPVESGLCKIIALGLGKHVGAARLHREGYVVFDRLILEAAEAILETGRVAFGLAVVENAYDETARIEALPASGLVTGERALLDEARRLMPRVLLPEVDVLVVEEFGKNISGIGMDANVTGRGELGLPLPGFDGPLIHRIVVLGLTPESGGNAHGIGLADVITDRALEAIDLPTTWTNSVTAGSLACGRIPPALPSDDQAVMAAASAVPGVAAEEARIVRIRNTLRLAEIAVSENLADVAAGVEGCTVAGVWDGTWGVGERRRRAAVTAGRRSPRGTRAPGDGPAVSR